MAMNENVVGSPPGSGGKRGIRNGLHPLHEAALRIADIGITRSRGKTKDLVGLLLAHGARAWRTGQPHAGIHLHVGRTNRCHPIRMRLR